MGIVDGLLVVIGFGAPLKADATTVRSVRMGRQQRFPLSRVQPTFAMEFLTVLKIDAAIEAAILARETGEDMEEETRARRKVENVRRDSIRQLMSQQSRPRSGAETAPQEPQQGFSAPKLYR
jgi:hypothetical protein